VRFSTNTLHLMSSSGTSMSLSFYNEYLHKLKIQMRPEIVILFVQSISLPKLPLNSGHK